MARGQSSSPHRPTPRILRDRVFVDRWQMREGGEDTQGKFSGQDVEALEPEYPGSEDPSSGGRVTAPVGNSGQFLAEFGGYTEGSGAPGAPGREEIGLGQ